MDRCGIATEVKNPLKLIRTTSENDVLYEVGAYVRVNSVDTNRGKSRGLTPIP